MNKGKPRKPKPLHIQFKRIAAKLFAEHVEKLEEAFMRKYNVQPLIENQRNTKLEKQRRNRIPGEREFKHRVEYTETALKPNFVYRKQHKTTGMLVEKPKTPQPPGASG